MLSPSLTPDPSRNKRVPWARDFARAWGTMTLEHNAPATPRARRRRSAPDMTLWLDVAERVRRFLGEMYDGKDILRRLPVRRHPL